jgi:hypothetical protein
MNTEKRSAPRPVVTDYGGVRRRPDRTTDVRLLGKYTLVGHAPLTRSVAADAKMLLALRQELCASAAIKSRLADLKDLAGNERRVGARALSRDLDGHLTVREIEHLLETTKELGYMPGPALVGHTGHSRARTRARSPETIALVVESLRRKAEGAAAGAADESVAHAGPIRYWRFPRDIAVFRQRLRDDARRISPE